MNARYKRLIFSLGFLALSTLGGLWAEEKAREKEAAVGGKETQTALNFKLKDIDGKETDLSSFRGKVLMFVNVASL